MTKLTDEKLAELRALHEGARKLRDGHLAWADENVRYCVETHKALPALLAEIEAARKVVGSLHIAAQDLSFVASHSANNFRLATMAKKSSNDAYAALAAYKEATE